MSQVTFATPLVYCGVLAPFPGAMNDGQAPEVHDECFQVGPTFPMFALLMAYIQGPAGIGIFNLWTMLRSSNAQLSFYAGPKPAFLP